MNRTLNRGRTQAEDVRIRDLEEAHALQLQQLQQALPFPTTPVKVDPLASGGGAAGGGDTARNRDEGLHCDGADPNPNFNPNLNFDPNPNVT